MPIVKAPIIIPSLGFDRLTEAAFMSRVNAIEKGLDGNPAYPASPVAMPEFKAAISAYQAAVAAALDGSKKAIEDRKIKRQELTLMLRLLGHYVESACKGDMPTFLSSGFEVASSGRTAPQPLVQPFIVKIEHGAAGELLVTITPVPNARSYDLESLTKAQLRDDLRDDKIEAALLAIIRNGVLAYEEQTGVTLISNLN